MAVYFVQSTNGGPIKIGQANDPEARLMELQTGSPAPLRILAVISGGLREEQALHATFAHSRMHGEWFRPDPQLLAFITNAPNYQPADLGIGDSVATFAESEFDRETRALRLIRQGLALLLSTDADNEVLHAISIAYTECASDMVKVIEHGYGEVRMEIKEGWIVRKYAACSNNVSASRSRKSYVLRDR